MEINLDKIQQMMKPVVELQRTFTTQEQYDLLNQIIVNYSQPDYLLTKEINAR